MDFLYNIKVRKGILLRTWYLKILQDANITSAPNGKSTGKTIVTEKW